MKNYLRYAFIAVLAFICNVSFGQEVTLDFTNNTTWKFPDGNKNGATKAAQFSNGTYTITVEAPTAYYWLSSNSALLYGKKDATITLPKFNFDVERIDIIGAAGASGKTTRNIFVGNTAVSTETKSAKGTHEYEIKADNQAANTEYIIKVTNANNDQIQKILIWKKGTAKPTETPTAANIAAFKALGVGKNAILTLKNAQVQYAGSSDIYVVDETGGIDIYQSNLKYTAGQILNGTITATYDEFNKLPELTNITENKLTATEGTVTPIEMTIEEAKKAENTCKLVTVKNITLVKIASGSFTNYYSDTEKNLQVYDKLKLGYTPNTESAMDYTGILIPFNTQVELVPTVAPKASTSNINGITTDDTTLNAPAYNLAGQKVGKEYKGVVIKAGKKFIQK